MMQPASWCEVVPAERDLPEQVEAAGDAGGKLDDYSWFSSDQRVLRHNPAADADPTGGRAAPAGGVDGLQRQLGAARPWRLPPNIGFFLVSGAAVVAATIAGVLFIHRPRETPVVRGDPLANVEYQKQMPIDRAPQTKVPATIAPLPGNEPAAAGRSTAVKATTRPDAIAATGATPAPASPAVVAATPTSETPSAGVIAEKRVATPPTLNEAKGPSEAEPKGVAIIGAGPERSSAMATASAVQPAVSASASATGSAVAAPAAPVAPRLPATEIAALLSRGDALLGSGDVTSARLFYQRAAEGGDAAAALRLGEIFDPAFLAQAGVGTVVGDAKKAAFWYRRASELGIGGATLLLRNIAPAKQQ
jgi:hypothetical protein